MLSNNVSLSSQKARSPRKYAGLVRLPDSPEKVKKGVISARVCKS